MKVKQVIKQVAMLLQLYNLIDANFEDYDSLDEQSKRDINILVSSANEVLSDISTDYIPLFETEEISVTNGIFDLDDLSKDFYKIVKFGNNDSYKISLNKILAKDGVYTVTYNYLPAMVSFDDEIVYDKRLTMFALSYGIAMEYCLICGNYAESEMWESKFKNALQNATKTIGVVKTKERRWR